MGEEGARARLVQTVGWSPGEGVRQLRWTAPRKVLPAHPERAVVGGRAPLRPCRPIDAPHDPGDVRVGDPLGRAVCPSPSPFVPTPADHSTHQWVLSAVVGGMGESGVNVNLGGNRSPAGGNPRRRRPDVSSRSRRGGTRAADAVDRPRRTTGSAAGSA